MNILPRDKQIEIIAGLTEGLSIRSIERLTGVHRDTIMRLGARIGRCCAELHDRKFTGIRTGRLELDELWAYVGKRRRQHQKPGDDGLEKGDQYTFVALASSARAIVAYRTGKRTTENTDDFIQDLRQRVIGTPEISTDGWHPYKSTIRDAFGKGVAHGVIVKTYSVTNLAVKEAARRYAPAQVVAVERTVMSGEPEHVSTSLVERSHLTMRMRCRRFGRLTNAASKKLENHAAAVSLYIAHYNLCRPHEALSPSAKSQVTPAMALGLTDHPWSIGELLDAALAMVPEAPENAPDRRRQFRVIEGGRE